MSVPTEIQKEVEQKAKQLGLNPMSGDVKAYCTEQGEWLIIVTRQGYRNGLKKQDDYHRHVVMPIYETTEVVMSMNDYQVRSQKHDTLVGAIGFLHKEGKGYYTHYVSLLDYADMQDRSQFWKTMPCTMIMRACEMGLVRVAYPDLFGNVYGEDELDTERGRDNKADIIAFLQANVSIVNELEVPVALSKMTLDELKELRKEVIEMKHNMENGDDEDQT